METNYDNMIQKLEDEVNQITHQNSVKTIIDKTIPKFIYSYSYYALTPVIIFIILFFCKPTFLQNEEIQNNVTYKKFSYSKLITWSFGLSIIAIVTLFAYTYKKE
jgi:hypothetical protein